MRHCTANLVLLMSTLIAAGCGSPEHNFSKLTDEFVYSTLAFSPVGATAAGLHRFQGPQCQPEQGDWYAQRMYQYGNSVYKFHVEKYGHPSKFGFKDVINEWKAEDWDPEHLISLYKRAGAKYFAAMRSEE